MLGISREILGEPPPSQVTETRHGDASGMPILRSHRPGASRGLVPLRAMIEGLYTVPPRLKAILLLAMSLVVTLFRRALTRRQDGLAAFRRNYASDGLAPVTPAQRADMSTFGGCIACGLCDRGESARMASSGGAYRGLMEIVLAGSRSMPDFAATAVSLSHVPVEVLADKERICPTGVPFRRMAAFVREKAGEARTSLPAAGSGLPVARP